MATRLASWREGGSPHPPCPRGKAGIYWRGGGNPHPPCPALSPATSAQPLSCLLPPSPLQPPHGVHSHVLAAVSHKYLTALLTPPHTPACLPSGPRSPVDGHQRRRAPRHRRSVTDTAVLDESLGMTSSPLALNGPTAGAYFDAVMGMR